MSGRAGLDITMNESEVAADANLTTLCLRINGRSIAVCNSDSRGLAEHYLCQFLEAFLNKDVGPLNEVVSFLCKQSASRNKNKIVLDVFITRSPCETCTAKLLDVAQRLGNIRLRIFSATIYKGETNTQSIKNINQLKAHPNIRMWRWDVVRMAQARDSDSITVLQVAYGSSLFNANAANSRQWHKLDNRFLNHNLTVLPYKTGSMYSLG